MSYVVLARKWRPMRFEDLVGQDHVAQTLGNAIDAGRVAHAFLFTGVRGVGKTTSARILAKALNCMREPGSLEAGAPDPGPTVTPCLTCAACTEIAEGRDLDVQEIDGASYNGVDEVRKLQDSLPYRPTRDRHKVIIVDEVHMLSQAAWNAFLKTLEEPPSHVKFIFATTEVHKVPITILSRVQRFDFKMIPTRLIVERLRWVLDQEGSSADDVALSILARQAAGSMRDAMSLLDQVIAFRGEQLDGDEVARVLGVASRGALFLLMRALVGGDPEKCLNIVTSLSNQGFSIPHLTRDILDLLRDLVVAKVCKDPSDMLDLADEERREVIALAKSESENDLLRLHQAFSRGYDDVVRGADPRAGLEMLLVRLSLRPPLIPLDELLGRIGHLEKRLLGGSAGAAPPGSSSRGSGGGGGPGRIAEAQAARRPRERHPKDQRKSAPSPPKGEDDVPDASPARDKASSAMTAPVSGRGPALGAVPIANSESKNPGAHLEKMAIESSFTHVPTKDETERLDFLMRVIERVRKVDKEVAAYLEQMVPLRADGETVELGLEKGHVFEKQITEKSAKTLLLEALRAECGQNVDLVLTVDSKDATPERSISAERARRRRARELAAIDEVKNHPRVREVIEIFHASIKSVHVNEVN